MARLLDMLFAVMFGISLVLIFALWPAKSAVTEPTYLPKITVISEAAMIRVEHRDLPFAQCLFWWRDGGVGNGDVRFIECPQEI